MRILWLTKVPPESHAPRIWHLATALAEHGHDVRILTLRIEPGQPRERTSEGVTIRYLRTTPEWVLRRPRLGFFASRLSWFPIARFAARRELRTEPADVVIEDLAPVGSIPVPIGAPVVLDVHYLLGSLRGWLRIYGAIGAWGWAYERLIRHSLIHPALVVSDSLPLIDRLTALMPGLDRRWIPNGVDADQYATSTAAADNRIRVLAVGRLVKPKGHEVLIDAVSKLPDPAAYRVTIVGDGPLESSLTARVAELHLDDIVLLPGRVAYDELPRTFGEADVFVMPSLAEGLPLALVQGLASGCAVIASDIPEHRQVADDGAVLFVRPGDPASLADAIDQLAHDAPRRAAMVGRAHALVRERYQWPGIVAQYERGLEAAVGG